MANGWGADPGRQWPENWPDPDLSVLRQHRRSPPTLPLDVFGAWGDWIVAAATAAACPVDYVALPLLSAASALIGHARWAQAGPGWKEPPHLWAGSVGDSGDGKSPGGDCLMRDVLPEIERRMVTDFPDRLGEWRAEAERHQVLEEKWKTQVRAAEKKGAALPMPPEESLAPEPQPPCLRQYDVTHEKVEELLALAAPKGLLILRDELSGWIDGMNAYNEAGRAFWIEAYGGRPYRVERKKLAVPLVIPRLAVSVYGGTQPDKIAMLVNDGDDGLLARLLWGWPEPVDFDLGESAPHAEWAIAAFDRLRELDLRRDGADSHPIFVPLIDAARPLMVRFGREMQQQQKLAGGLLRSAYGKARGQALRLSLVVEHLWWCSANSAAAPPLYISCAAFTGATVLMEEYFLPMAERVYGDAATVKQDRDAATLARWIMRARPAEVYVRDVLRKVRLPGLNKADAIEKAAVVLVDAGWLRPPAPKTGFVAGRSRNAYEINPNL